MSQSKSKEISLSIQGMTCGHCQARVERALRAVPGVVEVHVDLVAGQATVRGDVEAAALVQAADQAGYPARPL